MSRLGGQLILVGDRVLIDPDAADKTTRSGLYLPPTVGAKEKVHSGKVIQVGPGYLTADPEFSESEPWKNDTRAVRYLPLQAEPGDLAFFLKTESMTLEIDDKTYLVVPHAAIIALIRGDLISENGPDERDLYKGLNPGGPSEE